MKILCKYFMVLGKEVKGRIAELLMLWLIGVVIGHLIVFAQRVINLKDRNH